MDNRQEELKKLKSYTEKVNNDLTMILQSLQWDRKNLLQNPVLDSCKYDPNHKIPPDKFEEHEKICFLRKNGYSEEDQLLPDPLDADSNTLVKFIYRTFNGGFILAHSLFDVGCHGAEPMSLERLQVCYSADERRVIHDAVVSAVPSCHDLADLALLSESNEQGSKVILTRKEILLELRNMRRRRTKYRVAPKTRNYSDVLRDVIKTQMEVYNDNITEETNSKEIVDENNSQRDLNYERQYSGTDSHNSDRNRYHLHNVEGNRHYSNNVDRNRHDSHNVDRNRHDSRNVDRNRHDSHNVERNRYERPKKWVSGPIQVKSEREEPTERDRIDNRERSTRYPNDNERPRHERKKRVPRPIQEEINTETGDFTKRHSRSDRRQSRRYSIREDRHKHERPKKWVPKPIKMEIKTERLDVSERDRSSESTLSRRRHSEDDGEDRHERDENSVPKPIKEEIKTEREDSIQKHRNVGRICSSQDIDSVPRPIKVAIIKTEKEEAEGTLEHKKEKTDKTNRDEVSRTDERDRSGGRGHNSRETKYYEDNDQEKTQEYREHYRKRRDDYDYDETSYNRDKTRETQNYYDDKYRSEKRHKRSHRHDDHDFESKKRKKSQLDEESHGRKHREKRDDRRKDKDRRRKDKHTHSNYDDGGRYTEKAEDYRQGPSDSIHIKQETAESFTLRDNHNSCDDAADRDRNRPTRTRYYDNSDMQDMYDPNKKIKTEK